MLERLWPVGPALGITMVDVYEPGSAATDLISGIIEAAPDGIVMVDESGSIVLVNRQTEAVFGYDRGELLGQPVEMLLPERFRQVHGAQREQYHAEPRLRPMGAGQSLLGRRRDGTEFAIEISLSPLDADGPGRVIAMVRDITDRLEAERRLQEAGESLRLLEDRERIARDLHDLVIQRLFAAGMALQATISRLDDREVADRVSRVVDDLDSTIRQLRMVIFGLQDTGDVAAGLRSAVLQIVSEQRAALGFEPRIDFDGPVDAIGGAVAEHLLAVLREALANVARHAHATEVTIRLSADAQALTLRITDDGIGIVDAPTSGNGLRNARDRAISLAGACTVTPGRAGGTVFEWRVTPLGGRELSPPDQGRRS